MKFIFGLVSLALISSALPAQELNPAALLKPAGMWPSYNGDYSGRRFSPLAQINASNVRSLALQWVYRAKDAGEAWTMKATPLEVHGILYFSVPNNVWAVDARTGREIWHYKYPANEAIVIGNRGVGMYGHWLYYEAPDNYLVSLDAKDGKERWRVRIADVKLQYFSTMAPLVIGNHIMVGIGGDGLDNPGFLEAHDPETGALQWPGIPSLNRESQVRKHGPTRRRWSTAGG